ncbi:hypothetical protein TNIN_28581 [Trichonephila inaurata madagascariensis]|uniref:Reverse transcriptase n=1 Tax=Trichonephila inaurata madagascariensis TaxID=2747483 RepID=A0A8X7CGY5_9ARAC|nr:hypothetical protein TNIN_28581 [Trichonephila inaurata madagascariensis]
MSHQELSIFKREALEESSTARPLEGIQEAATQPTEQSGDKELQKKDEPSIALLTQLFYLVQSIIDGFQEKPHRKTTAVFLDLSVTFDRVWRRKLIEILHYLGISTVDQRRPKR